MIWHPEIQDGIFLYILDLFISIVSLVASFLMIVYCIRTMSTRSASSKLILAVAISDFVFSIANIISAFENNQKVGTLCKIEAITREASFILSIFFTTCISVLCYQACSFNNSFNQKIFFKTALVVGFIVTSLFVTRPLYLSNTIYTNEPLFCWIMFDKKHDTSALSVYRVISDDFPIILGLVITLAMYVGATRRIKNLPEEITAQMNIHVKKLFWYPLVLFGAVVPSLVDNFLAAYNPERSSWLVAAHFVLTHSIGLANAIVYGVQKRSHQASVKAESYATILTESFDYESY